MCLALFYHFVFVHLTMLLLMFCLVKVYLLTRSLYLITSPYFLTTSRITSYSSHSSSSYIVVFGVLTL
jgi:hypothetical protein